MPRSAVKLADDLVSHLNGLDQTRNKAEKLFRAGSLVRRDIEQVYGGLYLDAVTSFETFIENLFVGLLVGGVTPPHSGIVTRVNIKSHTVARDVVFGGRNYVDWLPFDYTERRAKAFFRNGAPFTTVGKPDKKLFSDLLYIRNAIAHKSTHSIRMFEREVIGSVPLTRRERTPTGFLRSQFRSAPAQTRYEAQVGNMAFIARKLCT
jgi:hypothetical protein